MSLSGRVAAITGASSGIGLACAKQLAREGVAVVLGARRTSLLESTASQIVAAGGRAAIVPMDVTREEDVTALVAMAMREFGRLDVMICNAGFAVEGSADDVTCEHMRQLLDVNYLGTFYGARAALPVFRRQHAGHLIFVSSIVGKRGVPHMGAYAATKFAQVGLAECLRSELVGSNIHVSVVFPVSTETEFTHVMKTSSGSASRARGPRQSAEQVADAIARGIARPSAEIYPYRKARALGLLNAIAPAFCDRFVKKFERQRVNVE